MNLRAGGRSLSESRERHRARSVLVVAQVAMALVLLVSAGLMIRTFQALHNVNPGFTNPEQIQIVRTSISKRRWYPNRNGSSECRTTLSRN